MFVILIAQEIEDVFKNLEKQLQELCKKRVMYKNVTLVLKVSDNFTVTLLMNTYNKNGVLINENIQIRG